MQKKLPMRMCVGCREMKPKRELVRICCSKEGDVAVDRTGKLPGRGAYVCPSRECLQRAVKSKALERAFSRKIGDEVFEALSERIEEAAGEGGSEA